MTYFVRTYLPTKNILTAVGLWQIAPMRNQSKD